MEYIQRYTIVNYDPPKTVVARGVNKPVIRNGATAVRPSSSIVPESSLANPYAFPRSPSRG